MGAESETAHESGGRKDGSAGTEVENDSSGGAGWKNVYGSGHCGSWDWFISPLVFTHYLRHFLFHSLVADRASAEQAGSMRALIG